MNKKKLEERKTFFIGRNGKGQDSKLEKKMTREEKRIKTAMATDEIQGTYEFYMDHLADYETLLAENPLRRNLSIAPKNKKFFIEDKNSEKKIVLPKKKMTLPLIKPKKTEETVV